MCGGPLLRRRRACGGTYAEEDVVVSGCGSTCCNLVLVICAVVLC